MFREPMLLGKQLLSVACNTPKDLWAGSTRLLCPKQLLSQLGASTPRWLPGNVSISVWATTIGSDS